MLQRKERHKGSGSLRKGKEETDSKSLRGISFSLAAVVNKMFVLTCMEDNMTGILLH